MKKINIHEAKTHLSRYLRNLESGETLLLCRRNIPIAEIRPIAPGRRARRPVGLARGTFQVGRAFFRPLPPGLAAAFEGGGS
jgi:antitoxin (DNA-binding transcriptional repressor) of toxin-antitoxin stability system